MEGKEDTEESAHGFGVGDTKEISDEKGSWKKKEGETIGRAEDAMEPTIIGEAVREPLADADYSDKGEREEPASEDESLLSLCSEAWCENENEAKWEEKPTFEDAETVSGREGKKSKKKPREEKADSPEENLGESKIRRWFEK